MSDMQGMPVKKIYAVLNRCQEGTGKIAAALAKAIPNIQPLVRNRSSHFAKKDPKTGQPLKDYADLAQCHKVAAKALAEQGLVVVQTITNNTDGDLVLCTQLLHSSGEWIESHMPIKASLTNPQQVASAITYARRTAYCSIIGLAADDDDDGADATDAATQAAASSSARIELMAMQRLRQAASQDERDEVMERVKAHVKSGTITEEAAGRIDAEFEKTSSNRHKEKKPAPQKAVPATT
jgi:hypothetical protein